MLEPRELAMDELPVDIVRGGEVLAGADEEAVQNCWASCRAASETGMAPGNVGAMAGGAQAAMLLRAEAEVGGIATDDLSGRDAEVTCMAGGWAARVPSEGSMGDVSREGRRRPSSKLLWGDTAPSSLHVLPESDLSPKRGSLNARGSFGRVGISLPSLPPLRSTRRALRLSISPPW